MAEKSDAYSHKIRNHGRGGKKTTREDRKSSERRFDNNYRYRNEFRRIVGCIPELPVLRPPKIGKDAMIGDSNDITTWLEVIGGYVRRVYGDIADIFKTGEYPEYHEPRLNMLEYRISAARKFAEKTRFSMAMKTYTDKVNKLEDDKRRVFAVVMGQLSEESKSKVQGIPGWAEIEATEDPLELGRRIIATHVVVLTEDEEEQKYDVRERYARCHQERNETTADYLKRYRFCLRSMTAAGIEIPEPRQQALDFFNHLDAGRYHQLQNNYRNRDNKREVMQDLDAAYLKASTFVIDRRQRDSDVYVGMRGAGRRGRGRGRGRGGRGQGSSGDSSCWTCGKTGHFSYECPDNADAKDREEASKEQKKEAQSGGAKKKTTGLITIPSDITDEFDMEVTNDEEGYQNDALNDALINTANISKDILAVANRIQRHEVCLDTGAGTGVFKAREHLTNITDSDTVMSVSGIDGGGSSLLCEKTGQSIFGDVYYNPRCAVNVVSYSKMKDTSYRCYQPIEDDIFRVQLYEEGDIYLFRRKLGIYVHNLNSDRDIIRNRPVYVSTVEENKKNFTKREVESAELARAFARKMANPSNETLIRLVNEGRVSNIPFTATDIRNAEFIWGRSLANIKGKTTTHKSEVVQVNDIPRPISQRQIFMMDLMFIEKIPFLISVAKPINVVQVNKLKDRTVKSIYKVVKKQLAVYRSRGFEIAKVRCDPESGLVALQPLLGEDRYDMDVAGQNESVPQIERVIRTVKERVRGFIHTLPYRLPLRFLQYLLFFCVLRMNMTPTVAMSESPFEQLHGRKLDYKRNFKASFGDYVQAHRNTVDNSMNTRADGGIALYDSGNIEGSWYIYNLNTNKLLKRNKLEVIPMPQVVIDHMNSLCSRERRVRGTEPIFEVGTNRREIDDDNDLDHEGDWYNRHQEVAGRYFRPNQDGATYNDPVDNFANEDEQDSDQEVALEHPDQRQYDMDLDRNVYDNDDDEETVEDIEESHDEEIFKDIADDIGLNDSDEETVGDVTGADEDEEIFQNIRNQSIREESETESGAGDEDTLNEEPTVIGGHRLRNRARLKGRREFGLHLSVNAAIEKLGDKATQSIFKELNQLEEKNVFEPLRCKDLSITDRKKIVGAKLFLKEKYKANGEFDKVKARLVAQQFKHTVFSEKQSSPTAATTSVFMIAGLAAREHRAVATVDFPGAYLNADMTGRVIVRLDKYTSNTLATINNNYRQYIDEDGRLHLLLKKALYGCVESARLWYERLKKELIKLGFKTNKYEDCVFNKNEKDGSQTTLVLHVDDMLVTAKSEEVIDNLLRQLSVTFNEVSSERGKKLNYLGMVFDFNTARKVKVTMPKYVDELMKEYEDIIGTAKTPANGNLFSVSEESRQVDEESKAYFHTGVAKLLYLSKRARPDILTAVSWLCTRVREPTEEDLKKLYRIICYLRGTKELSLTIELSDELIIIAYIDASYGVHADLKSHSGLAVLAGFGVILARSTKQKLNSKSSTEAELIGVSDGLNIIIWLRNFLIGQGYNIKPIDLRQDNMSTIKLIKNGKSNSDTTRHIAIKFYFITDNIARKEVEISYTPTEEMLADLFTKPLQGKQFTKLRNKILNITDDTVL